MSGTGEPGWSGRLILIARWVACVLAHWATQPVCGIATAGYRRRRDLDRTEKHAFVASLATVFAETSMVVVTQNNGLNVADVTNLRRRMREAGATYKVAKNRLALLALVGTRFDGIAPLLKGPTALAWARDPVAVAKVAVEFARTNDKFVVLGGVLGNQMLDASGIKALSELPSLDALRANFLGLLAAPATRIASILQAPGGQIARVLAAYARKDEAAQDGAAQDGATEDEAA